jgi:hypothetical protein
MQRESFGWVTLYASRMLLSSAVSLHIGRQNTKMSPTEDAHLGSYGNHP